MLLDLDVSDRRVVIFGERCAASATARRFSRAGARVRLVSPEGDNLDDEAALLRLLAPAWLVVTAGLSEERTDRVRGLCRQLEISCSTVSGTSPAPRGRVVLVGGGPGATQLLTLAACEALQEADVVCYDRLAPTDDLPRLAPGAELIDVGKLPYHHPTSQERIQELIIDRARLGQTVVRLKGGDAFVFGRGGEELDACRAAGIDVRVVPGVTSAVAVPAAAGIPVTHRGRSRAFTVVSGHLPPAPAELAAMAALGGTLVILMGMASLIQTVTGLIAAGMPGGTPTAIIERGYSGSQRTTTAPLADLPSVAGRAGVTSPAVVVIGEVAASAAEQPAHDLLAELTLLQPDPGR